jgi:hypothetical protein
VPLLVAGGLALAAPVLIVLSGIRRFVARPAMSSRWS